MRDMNFSYEPQPIMTINNQINKKLLNLTPRFQRGYIWKKEFKDELIVSIMSGYPIGNIIISKVNGVIEVVDGQQRLTTITNFIGNNYDAYEVKTRSSVDKIKQIVRYYYSKYEKIFSDNERMQFEKIYRGSTINYRDFPELIKDDFMSYNLNVTYITSMNPESIAEYFKFVQNQKTLKAGEIINSMYIYNVHLNNLISMIYDKSGVINILGLNSKRFEFDKHFVNFVGLLVKKLPLNSTQDLIVSFAQNYEESLFNSYIELLINNINSLIDVCIDLNITFKLNVRMMKVLFGYFSFYEFDRLNVPVLKKLIEDIDTLHKLEEKTIINRITFIEKSTKTFDEVKESAKNFQEMYDNRVKTNFI